MGGRGTQGVTPTVQVQDGGVGIAFDRNNPFGLHLAGPYGFSCDTCGKVDNQAGKSLYSPALFLNGQLRVEDEEGAFQSLM
jgi:hypothetical protein